MYKLLQTDNQSLNKRCVRDAVLEKDHLKASQKNLSSDSNFACYLPVVGVVLFFISFAMGLGGVPSVVSGEILPHQTKEFLNTGLRQ